LQKWLSRKTRAKQFKIKNGTLPKMAFEKNDRAPKKVPNSWR
jgi:hypothetical protein